MGVHPDDGVIRGVDPREVAPWSGGAIPEPAGGERSGPPTTRARRVGGGP